MLSKVLFKGLLFEQLIQGNPLKNKDSRPNFGEFSQKFVESRIVEVNSASDGVQGSTVEVLNRFNG
jgi:hypothetical protein